MFPKSGNSGSLVVSRPALLPEGESQSLTHGLVVDVSQPAPVRKPFFIAGDPIDRLPF